MKTEKICTKCKKLLPITNFYTNGFTPKGTRKYKGMCKECENTRNKERYIEKIKEVLDTDILECSICGYSKCYAALEFHHLDPNEKEYVISNMRNHNISNLKKEIDKCILLCANCHREVHNGVISVMA